MKNYDKFDNKKILIWGFGREGRSSKTFLEKFCHAASVEIFEGKRDEIDESSYDFIIKSPGIVMDDDDARFTSQTQIFLECFRDNTIGITGTKGKSTTSAMLYHVLSKAGKRSVLLGNIGEPCLDYFDQIDDDTIVVFEMSCHQLAHINVSPHVAVFLNLFEEHLDYYKTFDRYLAAKANITKYQTESDILLCGGNVPRLSTDAKVSRIDFNEVPSYNLSVLGHHNEYNAHFVYRIATEVLGMDKDKVKEFLATYKGLPHRLEFIGNIDGIDYYDDSISTIPSATIEALESVPNAGTVIIGGMDRGINYDTLIEYINTHKQYTYILCYDSGRRIHSKLRDNDSCMYVTDLKAAVKTAREITDKNKAVILSPASASYGFFKNFEERGEVFASYCQNKDLK